MSRYLVSPDDGSWVVRREGAREIEYRNRSQDRAIEKARELAEKTTAGQVLVLDQPANPAEEEYLEEYPPE